MVSPHSVLGVILTLLVLSAKMASVLIVCGVREDVAAIVFMMMLQCCSLSPAWWVP